MAGAPEGNDNAAVGAKMRDAIRYAIAKAGREKPGDEVALVKGLRALAEPQVQKALDGDTNVFKELTDRIDGKAIQSIDIDADVRTIVSGKVSFVE